jgi:dolichol-phosphate mannosyltransferase
VPHAPPRILIALATWNERDNLAELIVNIHRHARDAEVLVIDDNSPDGTGQLAEKLARQRPWLHVLHRPGKLGLGSALLRAMEYAMAQGYDLLVTMDADGSHAPCYLPKLLAGMARFDVMIGSRYVPGGGTINWPRSRRWMSWGVNVLVRVVMRLATAKDCSGGYRCYRVAKLRQAGLERILSHGYSFLEEVLYRCQRTAGCRVGETPISFENRRVGVSKVDLREMFRSLAVLLYLGVKALFRPEQRTADPRTSRPAPAPAGQAGAPTERTPDLAVVESRT